MTDVNLMDVLDGVLHVMYFDGLFDLRVLNPGDTVRSTGDGSGACIIQTPRGEITVKLGEMIVRAQDGMYRVMKVTKTL